MMDWLSDVLARLALALCAILLAALLFAFGAGVNVGWWTATHRGT